MLENEELLSLDVAVARLPRVNGKRLHRSAIYRWATKGVQGVLLESIHIGGRQLTSMAAIARFHDRLAEARSKLAQYRPLDPPKKPARRGRPPKPKLSGVARKRRSKAKRRASQKQAKARLRELGV